jgi:hypothetical protein
MNKSTEWLDLLLEEIERRRRERKEAVEEAERRRKSATRPADQSE